MTELYVPKEFVELVKKYVNETKHRKEGKIIMRIYEDMYSALENKIKSFKGEKKEEIKSKVLRWDYAFEFNPIFPISIYKKIEKNNKEGIAAIELIGEHPYYGLVFLANEMIDLGLLIEKAPEKDIGVVSYEGLPLEEYLKEELKQKRNIILGGYFEQVFKL